MMITSQTIFLKNPYTPVYFKLIKLLIHINKSFVDYVHCLYIHSNNIKRMYDVYLIGLIDKLYIQRYITSLYVYKIPQQHKLV